MPQHSELEDLKDRYDALEREHNRLRAEYDTRVESFRRASWKMQGLIGAGLSRIEHYEQGGAFRLTQWLSRLWWQAIHGGWAGLKRFFGGNAARGGRYETPETFDYLQPVKATLRSALQEAERMAMGDDEFDETQSLAGPTASQDPGALRVLLHVETFDRGGLEQVVGTLAEALRDEGAVVGILCALAGGTGAEQLQQHTGMPIYTAHGSPVLYEEALAAFKPDVVSSHYGFTHLDRAFEMGIPIVETIHNMYAYYNTRAWERERNKSRWIARYVAVSDMVKAYFARHMGSAISPERIDVIGNPIAANRLKAIPRDEARTALGIPSDAYLFLNLAAYDGRKNQLGLLTAFDQAAQARRDIHLLCCGNSVDPIYHQRVLAYQETLAASGRIMLRDYTDGVSTLFSAADCFVLASVFEGWSMAATEALACGLPLIHTDCGSAWELCGRNGERGVVVSNPAGDPLALSPQRLSRATAAARHRNTGELARALGGMADERQAWQARRSEIAAFAREIADPARAARRYLDVYRSAIAASVPRIQP